MASRTIADGRDGGDEGGEGAIPSTAKNEDGFIVEQQEEAAMSIMNTVDFANINSSAIVRQSSDIQLPSVMLRMPNTYVKVIFH